MKRNAIFRIVIFSILTILLLGLLTAGFSASYAYSNGFLTHEGSHVDDQLHSGSVPADEIRELEIEWVSGSISIMPADTDSITFSEGETNVDNQLVWKQTGDKLTIQFRKETIGVGFGFSTNYHAKDLTITVPQYWTCDMLSIESVSASIDASALLAHEIELDNVSGTCSFSNCTVQDLSCNTVSGKLNYTGFAQSLRIGTVSANCTAELYDAPDEVTLESVSGNMTIYLPDDTGFNASLDSMSGKITSDFPTTIDRGHHNHGNGHCTIDGSSVSGDIIIRKQTNIPTLPSD